MMPTSRRILASCALLMSATLAQAGDIAPNLSSPMVDRSIYRDGQVRRLSGRFGDWSVTCDEILGLKRRYCSLRSVAPPNDRRTAAYADLSTGDNGRPAALLHLPLGISVTYGVDVQAARPHATHGSARAKDYAAGAAHNLKIASCTPSECQAVWSLSPSEIQALDTGSDIHLTLCGPGPDPLAFATDLKAGSCAVKSDDVLSAAGFRDAIRAATS